ncbi:2-phosphosulfolactate phosphatase family protein [Clostridium sp. SHJSY1]|uniref:2-phosphosulfolactate phosphatase family protein n=1 Tax=Clostridium sp. SHJSY1 TaxID=2942483 RepID=UPI0028770B63|nr:2-phosphosulfolactate phosphatase family protein [Clostridium sp. SHJSY1]MDS0525359.1 2-phosphosulfolactate phosphatase family protein [Clostridium sp. SHJSY1]
MKVDVIISADYIREDIIKDKVVVVIDMLRATSVITTALMNGCKKVIPLLTIEESFKMRNKLGKEHCILGGERKAVKIEGFDLSNSPLEYTREQVEGKTVIITTTNGTRTITNCTSAYRILVGCMLNARAIANKLLELNRDVVIVNAGTNGQFSIDDYICTGFIIKEITQNINKLELTDISLTSLKLYERYPIVIEYIRDARHYNVMMSLGLEDDINYCVQKNITKIVPEYTKGHIIGIS